MLILNRFNAWSYDTSFIIHNFRNNHFGWFLSTHFFLSGRRRTATKFHCINCRLCSPFWMWMSIKSQSMNKARVFYGFVSFVGLEDVCIFYFFLLWLISVVIIKRHKRHPYFLNIIFRLLLYRCVCVDGFVPAMLPTVKMRRFHFESTESSWKIQIKC